MLLGLVFFFDVSRSRELRFSSLSLVLCSLALRCSRSLEKSVTDSQISKNVSWRVICGLTEKQSRSNKGDC